MPLALPQSAVSIATVIGRGLNACGPQVLHGRPLPQVLHGRPLPQVPPARCARPTSQRASAFGTCATMGRAA